MSHPDNPGTAKGRLAALSRATRLAICGSLAAAALAVFPAVAGAFMEAPFAQANPAVQVEGGFTLKGTIYPYELDTHYHFEYGTTTAYGTSTPEADAGSSSGSVPVSATVTGLLPSTTYHFRLVAANADGPAMSSDLSFTTPVDPNASPAPTPTPTEPRSGRKVRVKEVRSGAKTLLATAAGHTLYSLSVEKNGRFVCTKASGCLGLWHPLMVPKGGMPKGPVKLGTIVRPEGGTQVTYHGRPLYSFAPDSKPGDVKGQGIKDVGTWHAVTVAKKR